MPVEPSSINSGRPFPRQRCSLRAALAVSVAAHLGTTAGVSLGVHTMLGWDIFPSLLLGLVLAYFFVTSATILLCLAGLLLSMRRAVRDRRVLEYFAGLERGGDAAPAGARS